MNANPESEIFNSRIFETSIDKVYEAFSNPSLLKRWWGPHGFTNTIHEFDLRPGGRWVLTMHGPEKGHYENESVFKIVEPLSRIHWKRISQPHFEMELTFEKMSETKTLFSFRMIFDTPEACNKVKPFAGPKNEENFDRLENLLRDNEK